MLSADSSSRYLLKNFAGRLAKPAILLLISLGLLWFTEAFSAGAILKPESTVWTLWISYAKDLIQPFAFYFFLCLGERWLKTWRGRALLAVTVPTLLEFWQFVYYRVWSGHYIGAFDPIDLVMYATGVGLALLVEQKIFAKRIAFW
jgi:hypothetical protein